MKDVRVARWGKINNWIGRLLLITFILNILWFVWWRIIPLPDVESLEPEVAIAPIQEELGNEEMSDFEFDWDEKKFWAKPLFTYDLYGLVVSRNTYGSIIDPTNSGSQGRARDLCTVNGSTATSGVYQQMQFHSQNYTCWASWGRNPEVSQKLFKGTDLENNHLVTDNPIFRRRINSVNRGDQIHIRGYLVTYGRWDNDGKKYTVRKSSLTRTDSGDGACETIFVTDFEVIKKNKPFINTLMFLSRKGLWVLVLLKIISFFSVGYVDSVVTKERLRQYSD
jgi:hypothetical protein